MTPIKTLIKNALLTICLQTTAQVRPKEWPAPDEARKRKLDAIRTEIESMADLIHPTYRAYTTNVLAIVLDLPELKQSFKKSYFNPMTVVMFDEMILHIIVSGKDNKVLSLEGKEEAKDEKKLRPATDEEVEKCLDELTPAQVKAVLTFPVFEPYVANLYEDQTELIEVSEIRDDDAIVE